MKMFTILLAFCTFVVGATVLELDVKGTTREVARISTITVGVEKVINSKEFRDRVLASSFKETKDSPQLIYNKMTEPKWELRYVFEYKGSWFKCSDVTGWTYANVKTIWFNSCGFDKRKDYAIAGTECHEWAHKKGYGHKSAKSHQSVPYSLGTICAELYQKLVK